jgi:hypothetical protein
MVSEILQITATLRKAPANAILLALRLPMETSRPGGQPTRGGGRAVTTPQHSCYETSHGASGGKSLANMEMKRQVP